MKEVLKKINTMKNIIEILPSNITEALGWTLVHSIWQSLLLLTFYQIGSVLAKKSTLKYNLGLSLIGMQVIASFVTYLVIYEPVTAISSAPNFINYTQRTSGTFYLNYAYIGFGLKYLYKLRSNTFLSISSIGLALKNIYIYINSILIN